MSKERARTREARAAAREAERAAAARSRARRQKVKALTPSLPARPPKQRRYGAMPVRHRLGLAFGFLTVQFVGWQVLGGTAQRLGLFLLSLLALPLVVTLYLSPRSSR